MDTVSPSSPEIAVSRISLDSFDPEAMEQAVQQSQFEHCLDDGPGQFRGAVLQASNARTRLDWGQYNLPLFARGPFAPDRITLGLLLHEREDSLFNASVLPPASVLAYGEGEELNTRLCPNSNWVSIQVDRNFLAHIGIELSSSGFNAWRPGEGSSPALRVKILKSLHFLESMAHEPCSVNILAANQSICDVEDYMLLALANANITERLVSCSTSTNGRDEALHIVREASNYMDDNLEYPVTMSEICLALKTTIKSLQRAFLRTYGTSPKQYLMRKRLSKLRRLLICGDIGGTLVDAYLSCGLSHFGRAAQNYRAVFGELPSRTLAQSRSLKG